MTYPQQENLINLQIEQYQADYDQLEHFANKMISEEPGIDSFINWLCILMENRTRALMAINPSHDNLNHYEHDLVRIRFLDDLVEKLLELKP